jgi:hypothetical protein
MPLSKRAGGALIEALKAERVRLQGELTGIEKAITLAEHPFAAAPLERPQRGNAKTLLIDLLQEVKEGGLNASLAEQLAAQRGKVLKRGTAGSNLSRMKADGVVNYDGDKYRLPQYTRAPLLAVAGGKVS